MNISFISWSGAKHIRTYCPATNFAGKDTGSAAVYSRDDPSGHPNPSGHPVVRGTSPEAAPPYIVGMTLAVILAVIQEGESDHVAS